MAYINTHRASHAPSGAGIGGIVTGIADRWRRYRVYRTTLSELDQLDARELDDLGLNKSMLRSIAYETAYMS